MACPSLMTRCGYSHGKASWEFTRGYFLAYIGATTHHILKVLNHDKHFSPAEVAMVVPGVLCISPNGRRGSSGAGGFQRGHIPTTPCPVWTALATGSRFGRQGGAGKTTRVRRGGVPLGLCGATSALLVVWE
jgi:hypothetical protein